MLPNDEGWLGTIIFQLSFIMMRLQSDGSANVVTAIVFVVIDTFAVILRLISKRKTKHYFSSDDQWILCALILFFGWAGQIIYCRLLDCIA